MVLLRSCFPSRLFSPHLLKSLRQHNIIILPILLLKSTRIKPVERRDEERLQEEGGRIVDGSDAGTELGF